MFNLFKQEKRVFLDKRNTIIVFRWVIFLFLVVMMFYSKITIVQKQLVYVMLLLTLYAVSNIVILFLHNEIVLNPRFRGGVFVVDTLLISIGIYLTQGFNSDLYLIYFIVIFISSIGQDVRSSLIIAFISSILYMSLATRSYSGLNVLDSAVLIRIPFLFMIALFSTYFAQESVIEKKQFSRKIVQVEKMLFLGECVAGIIHQVKHPLGSIMAQIKMIEQEKDIEKINIRINKISGHISETNKMVEGFLDFARNKTVQKKKTGIIKIIDDTLYMYKDQFIIDNIKIDKVYRDVPELFIDSELIRQVFLNLINNARQSILKKNVLPGYITVETQLEDNRVKIKFIDTGTGISEENLAKLFTPFFTTKHDSGGTGLGLSIVQNIINVHGGKISVFSKLNESAVFIIELPVTEEKNG